MDSRATSPVRLIGRYALYGEIASGGMATVHFGRLLGPVGFARTVAIKRLHPHFAKDADFAAMFLDEARVAARIQHPNVVPTLDVVSMEDELFLVMEYVDGESLSRLLKATKDRKEVMPIRIAVAIVSGALHGLHAAHEAKSERGEPLHIVHRDVSPQNVLIGRDGNARVLDFGVAKAAGRLHSTREGSIKGKVAYMAPEQIRSQPVDRRADVYAAGVVLWEALTLQKLFRRDNDAATLEQALYAEIPAPSTVNAEVSAELDAVVKKALNRDPEQRYQTARDMALALERAVQPELPSNIGEWLRTVVADQLADRASRVAEIESASDISSGHAPIPVTSEEPTKSADVSGAVAAASGKHAPPPDDVSLLSASMSPASVPPQRPQRRAGLIVGALVALGLVAVALAIVSSNRTTPAATGPTTSAPPTTVAVSPPASVTVPVTASASATATSTAPSAIPSAVASAVVKPKPTATSVKVNPAASANDDCKVPYTVDSQGTTIYKRQCL